MDFLHDKILDNTIQNLLIAVAVILLAVILNKILSRYTASLFYLFIKRSWKKIELKDFCRMFLNPLSAFITLTIALIALNKLQYPHAWEFTIYKVPFSDILEKFALGLFIFFFFRLLMSVVDFISLGLAHRASLTKEKSDDQLVVFFRDFIKVTLGIVAVLLILKASFNQNIGNLLTGLSIIGAALALSARESLENLIASFIIFFDKPFYVGDNVKVNAVAGRVERIGLRSTRIRTAEKTLVTVPNKQMVDSVVDNQSMRTQRRAEIKLELSEKTTAAAAQNFTIVLKAFLATNKEKMLSFSVLLSDYSKNGTTVTVEYFTAHISMQEFNERKEFILLHIMQLMEDEKLEMAAGGPSIIIDKLQSQAPVNKPLL